MKRTAIAILAAMLIATAGCAKIVIPYDSEPLCSKGKIGGYCGPITEVYDEVSRQEEEKRAIEKIKARGQKAPPYKLSDERSGQ